MEALGIDIGGSGIKGGLVDTSSGELKSSRLRIPTPSSPEAVTLLPVLQKIIRKFDWNGKPLGIGFPGVIHDNIIGSAVNLHPSLVGLNLEKELKTPALILNDADAAGYAEMQFGAGKPYLKKGTVLLLTIGTGIGSVLFRNGLLVPNLEFGHLEYKGRDAETYVGDRARKEHDLSWKRWGKRFNGFLLHLEFITQPDLIIVGGGVAKKSDKFREYLKIKTPWTVAESGNQAGIIGAACAAILPRH